MSDDRYWKSRETTCLVCGRRAVETMWNVFQHLDWADPDHNVDPACGLRDDGDHSDGQDAPVSDAGTMEP